MPNNKNGTNQIKWGAFLSYGQMALSVIIGLLYTPVMIRLLGKSEYGLYNTVASTISILGILNVGFNSGYIRYFARYKKDGEEHRIHQLNGLFVLIFVIIGIIAFACGFYLAFHLEYVFKTGLEPAEYVIAKKLMILMTVTLSLSFPMGVLGTIISAHERFVFAKLVSMLTTIVSPMVCLPLLLMGYRSVALVTASLVIYSIVWAVQFYYVHFRLKQRFVFHSFEKGVFKSLFVYTGFIALNLIVDQINTNVDNLLLARFQGTAMVSIYAVGASLHSYYQRFSTAISGVFTPRIHHLVNGIQNPVQLRSTLTDLFVKVGRIQYLVLALICSGFVLFGREFITLYWAGDGYEVSYYVALLLMIPSMIPLTQNLGIEIQRAFNKHQFRSIFYSVMALINLGLSIVLCQKYGAVGSALGTAVAVLLANGLAMNIYYHRHCSINILEYWKNISKMTLGLVAPVVITILVQSRLAFDSLSKLLIGICGYTILYSASMWFFAMNQFERDLIIRPIKRIVAKVKP